MSGIHNQYVDARRSRAISIAKQGSKGFGRVISNPKGGLHG
ncbi:MAG: hypothetical protein NTY48_04955 [Candidatus Diapherotrites archaeon]|nr:hypothetical protein [Candidatus Diapherotrites archaeon]